MITQGFDDVNFQWVRTDGTYFNENNDMEISGSGLGSGSTTYHFFNSTFNVANVNYTYNDAGYYCNAPGYNKSKIAYLTGSYIAIL